MSQHLSTGKYSEFFFCLSPRKCTSRAASDWETGALLPFRERTGKPRRDRNGSYSQVSMVCKETKQE